ncbi:uncharacterized protein LOC135560110 [Oncorhynchus nerka]|uniref:uncharacterized protein LOC135560110 n=1 Tax=Oncorhynchus nerka TaxID=8023 RepID=UPI0031B8B103
MSASKQVTVTKNAKGGFWGEIFDTTPVQKQRLRMYYRSHAFTPRFAQSLMRRGYYSCVWQSRRQHQAWLCICIHSMQSLKERQPEELCPETCLPPTHHQNTTQKGTSVGAEHFQAYLLEWLVGWNEDRAEAAAEGGAQKQTLHCYDGVAQYAIIELSQKLLGCSLVKEGLQSTLGNSLGSSISSPRPMVTRGWSPTSVRTQTGHLIYLRERRMTPPCPCPTSMTVSHQSLHSGRPLHRPLNPSQVPVVTPPDDTAPAASQDPEDDEYIGLDGVSGYQHVVLLATSQPLPPLPSLSSTSLPITPVSQDLPSTSTPLPPPAGGPKVSRTTEWRRRKKLESGIKVRVHKPYEGYKCSKCGKPKTSEFGHMVL